MEKMEKFLEWAVAAIILAVIALNSYQHGFKQGIKAAANIVEELAKIKQEQEGE
jgi:hypothetical protein